MFDTIARRYDLLNRLLSLGSDVLWRRKTARILEPCGPGLFLDVAAGTGDLSFECARHLGCTVIGADVSLNMLSAARDKKNRAKKPLPSHFTAGDCAALPFRDGTFDAATVAFGVRNFKDLPLCLGEIKRTLRPGAPLIVLEFSMPRFLPLRKLYGFYLGRIVPLTGGLISGNRTAYDYLASSIKAFPCGRDFLKIMEEAGFRETRYIELSLGVASIYSGIKPRSSGFNSQSV